MRRTVRFGLVFLCLLTSQLAQSQTSQQDYIQAKQYFSEEKYKFASEYFKRAAKESSPYQEYALFYLGLSSYYNGELGFARSTWRQIQTKYPRWNKINEVHYWLSKVYFDEGNFLQGMTYAKKTPVASSDFLRSNLSDNSIHVEKLKSLQRQFPDEQVVAEVLVEKLASLPNSERDYVLINQLTAKFDINRAQFDLPEIGDSQFKNKYKVAVILPFLFDDLSQAGKTVRNKFVMDLYEGIKWAAQVNNKGKKVIELYPYDSKRSPEATAKILARSEMKSMDLIIGPLFEEPFNLVSDFAFINKINLVHPLSTKSEMIRNNPYAFLFRPSIEAQAEMAAEVVSRQAKNKNAMIFYESNPKDSLSALAYSKRIKELGFNVLTYQSVDETTVRDTYDDLTEVVELIHSGNGIDSLRAKGRIIKQRKSIRNKGDKVYFEEVLKIKPDSVGHIYVASSKPLFASNYVSAVEIRNDSTIVVGRGNWLDFEMLTYEELERLSVMLVDLDFIDINAPKYQEVSLAFMDKFRRPISENVIIGYELMNEFSQLLTKNGSYFQNNPSDMSLKQGVFFEGINFASGNSNQYVPVLRISEAKLKVINKIKNDR